LERYTVHCFCSVAFATVSSKPNRIILFVTVEDWLMAVASIKQLNTRENWGA